MLLQGPLCNGVFSFCLCNQCEDFGCQEALALVELPSTGLLQIQTDLLCFLLFTSIGLCAHVEISPLLPPRGLWAQAPDTKITSKCLYPPPHSPKPTLPH